MTTLTLFDYSIFIIIGISILFAFFKGFIRSVLSLIKLILALTAAALLFPITSDILADFIGNMVVVNVTAALLPFLILLIVLTIFNNKLLAFLEDVHGGAIDRSMGAAFGLVRGCLLASIIFFIINVTFSILYTDDLSQKRTSIWTTNKEVQPDWLKNSESYHLLKITTEFFTSLLPDELRKSIDSKIDSTSEKRPHKQHKKIETEEDKQVDTLRRILNRLPTNALPFVDIKQMRQHPESLLTEDHRHLLTMLLESYQQHVKIGTIDSSSINQERLETLLKLLPQKKRQATPQPSTTADGSYSEDQIDAIERLISTMDQ